MKVITLTQPWASLVALGAKRIETRSWTTSYRGPLYIHAAKGFPEDARELCFEEPFRTALGRLSPADLPRGAVLASAYLKHVLPVKVAQSCYPLSEMEREFGDFSSGRFAWFLEDVVALAKPIPAKGSLGLWEYPALSRAEKVLNGELFKGEGVR